MRGIILAAGKGSRLNGTAGESRSASSRRAASRCSSVRSARCELAGIDDIASSSAVRRTGCARRVGTGVTYVENARFAETNSLYSLWMARALLYEGFVVLNCDVLFHPVLLDDLLTSRHDARAAPRLSRGRPAAVRRRRDEGQGPVRPGGRHVEDDGPGRGGRREPRHRQVRPAGRHRPRRHHGPARRGGRSCATGRRGLPRVRAGRRRCTPSARAAFPGSRSTFPRTTSARVREVLPAIEADSRRSPAVRRGARRSPPDAPDRRDLGTAMLADACDRRPASSPTPASERSRPGILPRIVAIGGGTGPAERAARAAAAALPARSAHAGSAPRDRLVAVVATSDDGGSSGRLRAEFNIIPPGRHPQLPGGALGQSRRSSPTSSSTGSTPATA